MTQPTNYTPTTDFSQQEAINASGRSTVNTAALDAEFANIETTLDQTVSNLSLIQRDDGRLKDLSVDVHTLTRQVLNLIGGFALKGAWASATSYYAKDIVDNAGILYVCSIAHTSPGSFVELPNWMRFGFSGGEDAAASAALAAVSAANADISEANALAAAAAAAASATASNTSRAAAVSAQVAAASSSGSASVSATNAANSASAAALSAASVARPIPVAEGGTGATTAAAGLAALGGLSAATLAASSGASLVGFTNSGTGSVPRTMQDKVRELVSVKDFGAVGDGVADDTVSLQAAITRAVSAGRTLLVPAGTYKLTSTITIDGTLNMSGDGMTTTVFNYKAVGGYAFQTSANFSNSCLEKFKLIGPGRDTATNEGGINIVGNVGVNRNITLNDVWVEGFNLYGVNATALIAFKYEGGRVRSCGPRGDTITASGAGINIYSDGVTFKSPTTAAILVYINNVSFSACNVGIKAPDTDTVYDCFVTNSDLQSNRVGIQILKSRQCAIISTYFESNDEGGAQLKDGYDYFCRQSDVGNEITYINNGFKLDDVGYKAISSQSAGLTFNYFELDRTTERVIRADFESGGLKFFPVGTSGVNPSPAVYCGSGANPHGVVAAMIGSLYFSYNNPIRGQQIWVKVSGSSTASTTWLPVLLQQSGSTGVRPATLNANSIGAMYFDTTLQKPIWWNGTAWKDATGEAV